MAELCHYKGRVCIHVVDKFVIIWLGERVYPLSYVCKNCDEMIHCLFPFGALRYSQRQHNSSNIISVFLHFPFSFMFKLMLYYLTYIIYSTSHLLFFVPFAS